MTGVAAEEPQSYNTHTHRHNVPQEKIKIKKILQVALDRIYV